MMDSKKRKLARFMRHRLARLLQKHAAVEAQIARLEKDRSLGLATRDHFDLWHRPSLFAGCPSKASCDRPSCLH
jgi:hypothetical protein